MRVILLAAMAVRNDVHALNTARLNSLDYLQLDEKAEWGFLKNIVNIDTFFATDSSNKPRRTRMDFNSLVQQASQ